MSASMAQTRSMSTTPSPFSSSEIVFECASEIVFGLESYLDPLKWRATKAHELPMLAPLAPLARLVLAIPASQEMSKSLFSSARVIVELAWCGQRRASHDPEELLDGSRGVKEVESRDTGFHEYS